MSNNRITNLKYGKIRTYGLLSLQHMCRLNDKYIFDKWHILLPRWAFTAPVVLNSKDERRWALDQDRLKKWCSASNEPNLLNLFMLSKDPKVRIAVANTLAALIDHSPIKTWHGTLGSTASRKKPGSYSFTSLSEALGNLIVSFHYIFMYYLNSDSDPSVRLHLIKGLSVLLNVTQYQKISPGLVTYTLNQAVWSLLKSPLPNETLLLLCLNCFTSVANQRFAYPEFEQQFVQESSPTNIVKYVIALGMSKEVGRSTECLTLLSKLSKNYSQSLYGYWMTLIEYLKLVFKDNQAETTLGGVRVIEEYVKHTNAIIYMSSGKPQSHIIDVFDNTEFLALIQDLLQHNLIPSKDGFTVSELQTELMNVLGIMSESQFGKLLPDVVARCVDFVITLKGTGMPQSVAMKALGTLATFATFSKDFTFVSQCVTKLISCHGDNNFLVATKTSWALANVCYCVEGLAKLPQYPELGLCALEYAKSSKEKIASNGIRALGYWLKKVESSAQFAIGSESLDRVLGVVVAHLRSKNPKIAWNACVAIGNILSNPHLPKSCLLYESRTFHELLVVIVEKPNIKTKLHAIQALQTYRTKEDYGPSYEEILAALIGEYSETDKMQLEDVAEYKYKDKLELLLFETIRYMLCLWDDSQTDADGISERVLNRHAGDLLSVLTCYLRKTLKLEPGVTLSTEEAQQAAKINDVALKQAQSLAQRINNWVTKSNKAHVSFGVVQQLQEIATTPLEKLVCLPLLSPAKPKPKFAQTFQ